MNEDGRGRDWSAPPELAGMLRTKVGHTKDEIAEMESLARSLEWTVTPHDTHEPCKTCEAIKAARKSNLPTARFIRRMTLDSLTRGNDDI